MSLTAAQRDRACGTLLGAAAGGRASALATNSGPGSRPTCPVDMIGGGLGPFKPGECTDDTSMAIAIAEIAATGADLRDEAGARLHGRPLALVGQECQRHWCADPLGRWGGEPGSVLGRVVSAPSRHAMDQLEANDVP